MLLTGPARKGHGLALLRARTKAHLYETQRSRESGQHALALHLVAEDRDRRESPGTGTRSMLISR